MRRPAPPGDPPGGFVEHHPRRRRSDRGRWRGAGGGNGHGAAGDAEVRLFVPERLAEAERDGGGDGRPEARLEPVGGGAAAGGRGGDRLARARARIVARTPERHAIGAGPPAAADPPRQRMVSLMGRRQRWTCRALIAAWLGSNVLFWTWWLRPEHVTTTAGMAATSVLLGSLSLTPAWAFFFIARATRPERRRTRVPRLRVAMVVTKVPKEPWPMVRHTLEAMLHQDFPYAYDVWLADEGPTEEAMAWCAARRVSVISRRGIAEYNRPTYPRRARTKEGNLSYFYDTVGYRRYDVVAQFDADHVPSPRYLREVVPPFADPRVGYVAAPSVCDANAGASWSARGRLHCEGTLHGATQAGSNGGYGPSCIGSHYTVRTAALRDIGGLGPELAEDFSTSVIFNAFGWHGAFAIDAEAQGDGPESVADCVMQDFQWARSVMNVVLRCHGLLYWRALGWPTRLRLSFCSIWYPLHALQMLAGVTLPLVAVATGTALVDVRLVDFVAYSAPAVVVLVLFGSWLRRNGWFRPAGAPVLSWESTLFQLVRWPWVLVGCAAALAGWALRRDFSFVVTSKRASGARPLPLLVLVPYLVLAAAPALVVVLFPDAGGARGYYLLALLLAVTYLAVCLAVIALHAHENRRRAAAGGRWRRTASSATALACAGALVAAGLLAHGGEAARAVFPGAPGGGAAEATRDAGAPGGLALRELVPLLPVSVSPPTAIPPGSGVELGLTGQALTTSYGAHWGTADLDAVRATADRVGTPVRIVQWFADWAHTPFSLSHLEAVARAGAESEITWEPWDAGNLDPTQPGYTLASIIGGQHDDYIKSWAWGVRQFGAPVRIRLAQEMNGTWYPWAEHANGNQPGQYAAAWRHVHDIFTAAGARNVEWTWSPIAGGIDPATYPGDAYVDLVGLSGFNGGTQLTAFGGWRSFAEIFAQPLAALAAIAPGKPVEISEVGSAQLGGDKAAWTADAFAQIRARPSIVCVIWFDVVKEADWRITVPPAAGAAFARGVSDPYFQYAGPYSPQRLRSAQGGPQ